MRAQPPRPEYSEPTIRKNDDGTVAIDWVRGTLGITKVVDELIDQWVDNVNALTLARNQLGNAVGAIIDSGSGYCEGPHDVAAAIYRLTAERDALKADLEERRAMPYRTPTDQDRVDAHWAATKGWMKAALDATRAPSAVGGAPGVSETHTDPKEAR